MGCTPSKSTGVYTHDRVCRDLDTCSTFVPSLKSSLSTPERPGVCVETSGGKQAFLNVPCRDVRSVSMSSDRESWSSAGRGTPTSSSRKTQLKGPVVRPMNRTVTPDSSQPIKQTDPRK